LKRLGFLVLGALAAGIVTGGLARSSADPWLADAADVLNAIGGLWLNALRMTVVPLVASLLIVGVASVADTARTGGLVARAVLLFTVLLLLAGCYGVAATQALLSLWPVDADAATAFISSLGGQGVAIAQPPGFADWLRGLAPGNPVRAAADDAVLQLVVFSLFFGFAVTRIEPALRERIVTFFRAVSAAMIVIVHWVLLAAPVGVFALAVGVGMQAGFGAAGTLVHYVVVVTAVTIGVSLLGWLLAILAGGQSPARFSAAAAPVWAIAASTQSSLASLPAMLQAALRDLRIPARIADVILPLAVAVFRLTSPVANLAVCFFIAHLYGLEPTLLQTGAAIVVAYAMSIAAVGLPGQISFVASIAPICLALGVPIELLGILIAVEVVPDIFRTVGNVTGDLAATAILGRGAPPDSDVD